MIDRSTILRAYYRGGLPPQIAWLLRHDRKTWTRIMIGRWWRTLELLVDDPPPVPALGLGVSPHQHCEFDEFTSAEAQVPGTSSALA